MLVDTRLTYDDYCLLPNNGRRYEIIDGELFVTPSPRRAHQKVVTELSRVLGNFVKETGGGEVYVAPFDVVFLSTTSSSRIFFTSRRNAPR
jgi:Uma2 family endonuclease